MDGPIFIGCERQIAAAPEHIEALANLGYIAVEQGRFPEAETHLQNALALSPNHAEARFDLGRCYGKQRRYEPAIREMLRVVQLSPEHAQAHYQLFLFYSRTKQEAKAQAELATFKKIEELNVQVTNIQLTLDKARKRKNGAGAEEPAQPAGMGQPTTLPPPPPGAF